MKPERPLTFFVDASCKFTRKISGFLTRLRVKDCKIRLRIDKPSVRQSEINNIKA